MNGRVEALQRSIRKTKKLELANGKAPSAPAPDGAAPAAAAASTMTPAAASFLAQMRADVSAELSAVPKPGGRKVAESSASTT